MPPDGGQLDELLTGYMDGRLDADELHQVEEVLRSSKAVRRQLDDLIAARESLVELGRMSTGRRLSPDFTERVLAATGELRTRTEAVEPPTRAARADSPGRRRTNRLRQAVLLVASLAAVVLAIINLPKLWDGKPAAPVAENQSQDLENDASSEVPLIAQQSPTTPESFDDVGPSVPVSYLGDIEAPVLFAYVMHVRPTTSAFRAGILESLLMQAGIRAVAPIVADDQVEQALRDTSMIVMPNEVQEESAIYFIRAESTAIDRAFRSIWVDTDNFPDAHYNLAMDNPQTRLMSKIAQSTGKRFAVNDSFAAPIAVVDETGAPESRIPGLKHPVYVSVGKRGDDFGQAATLGPAATGDMSTVMIVVHVPNDL